MSPQAAKKELRPGSLLSGKYRLQRQLGRGASGAVWSAINVATSRKVALKVLLRPEPKARERLLREARAAGALKHPNVVDVYDVIVADDGSPALVLEFLEGQTLEQLIAERAPLPESEVAMIARDVARALAVAHASGIVHRDLKPANIFLHRASEDEAPVVKVVDFGISKNTLAREETLTETGMAVGSPSFMSPEQVRGERDLDGRTDLWALGVIMYEMLSAKRLFDGRAHEVLTHVLTQPIKPLGDLVAGLDPEIDRVVAGLLERDLDKRTASADDVALQLTTFTAAAKERTLSPTESPPTSRNQQRDTPIFHVPKAAPVPVINADDEEEATHVAPMAMRQALPHRTVPAVYQDDDEEEEDRTRVAPDAVLTAAIQASKQASPDSDPSRADPSNIPTVRPPAPDAPAEKTLADSPPLTDRGTQVMAAHGAASGRGVEKPNSGKSPPAVAAKLPVSNPSSGKAPVSGSGAGKAPVSAGMAHRAPIMGPAIGRVPVSGAGGGKLPVSGKPALSPASGKAALPGLGVSVPKPPPDLSAAAPHHEEAAAARAPEAPRPASERSPAAQPVSEKAAPKPVSEKPPVTQPISERAAPTDSVVPSSRRPAANKAPSLRPQADEQAAPRILLDNKSVSERPAPTPATPASASVHRPSSRPPADAAAERAPTPKPSSVETAVHRVSSDRSDAVRTWVLTLIVAALVVLAIYLYTHRG